MWNTYISNIEEGNIYVKGYELSELMEKCSFSDIVFLMTIGDLPKLSQKKLMEAILVSCCDQSIYPPSTNATRFVASCGVPLQAAVAAGILAFGDHHGGAIENCAKLLQENIIEAGGESTDEIAAKIIKVYRDNNERVPGFGHAFFERDPRSVKLLEIAESCISPRPHIDLLRSLEAELSRGKAKNIASNINGAIAASISDLGIDWRLGRGLFIISRSIGLVAHAAEETREGKKYRKTAMKNVEYLGPAKRTVPLRLEVS